MKLVNSIFHDTARDLNEFLTGFAESCRGPTENMEGMVSIFLSSSMKFCTLAEQWSNSGWEDRKC